MTADVHPAIEVLAPLLGTWSGHGRGDYPTIEAFEYVEEVTFSHVGKPFLSYTQRTRSDGGVPLHAEAGYLRVPAAGRIELVLAHPTGITEIDEGTATADGGVLVIDVHSTTIGLSGSAKDVFAVSRSFQVDGDELRYTVSMAAVGHGLQHHLSATLHRMP
ncbi:MAG: FABP family protein [Mycobacterium sp.]|nr:FABP family protein [Mycobacterium sp.]